MDDHIASALGVITHKNVNLMPEVMPLCIYSIFNIDRHLSTIEEIEGMEHNPLINNTETI
jgi:hypothetical protein